MRGPERGFGIGRRIAASLALLFATAATLLAQQPQTLPGMRLDFRNAPLADVIRAVAQAMGVNVALGDVPDRRITFTTGSPVSLRDLPGVLESILETNGLVLVQQGNVAQVFAAEKAPATGQVRFGWEFPDPPPLGMVSQLVPLLSIGADEGAAALSRIAGPTARIEPVARSNALLTERAGRGTTSRVPA